MTRPPTRLGWHMDTDSWVQVAVYGVAALVIGFLLVISAPQIGNVILEGVR